jgi:hypothetical protein
MPKPEAIDLLLAAGALERVALVANPVRRCPLERVADYLRELAGPIERKPVSEWRQDFDPERCRALIADVCAACGQAFMPDHSVCFSAECVRARLEAPPECPDCGCTVLHVAGPHYAGTVCEECNPDSSLLDDDDELTDYELDQEAAAFGVTSK